MKNLCAFACLVTSAANAAIITYTDRNAFVAALTGASYEESFAGIGSGNLGVSSMNFSGNGLAYTISTSGTTLYGGTVSGDRSMSVDLSNLTLTVSNFTGGVTAIGGYFYFDNGNSALGTTGTGAITASNGIDSPSVLNVTAPSSLTGFFGFISTQPLTTLTYVRTSGTGTAQQFPNIDDLIVSAAADQGVPEPSSIGLALAGLATLAILRKRR